MTELYEATGGGIGSAPNEVKAALSAQGIVTIDRASRQRASGLGACSASTLYTTHDESFAPLSVSPEMFYCYAEHASRVFVYDSLACGSRRAHTSRTHPPAKGRGVHHDPAPLGQLQCTSAAEDADEHAGPHELPFDGEPSGRACILAALCLCNSPRSPLFERAASLFRL